MPAGVGLDIGTTNVKAVLVDDEGRAVVSAQRGLRTTRSDEAVEQDAEALWRLTIDSLAEIVTAQPDVAAQAATIGVCSQYSSLVPVDDRCMPVAPMVLWSDRRGTDHSLAILEREEEAFLVWLDVHGIPPVGGGLSLAHLLHLQLDRPETHAATAAYLEPMDYVTARLTGRIAATQHSMFMSQLCDNRALDARQYAPALVALAGVDPAKLPPLVDPDEALGTLRPEVAERTGLPIDAVVYPGTNDTAIVGTACGVVQAGRAGLAIGTTSVVVDSVDRKDTDVDHEILSMPGLATDRYLVFAENGYGGRLVEYVLDEIVYPDDVLASHSTAEVFARLDAALAASRPGAGGALFLPWLSGSLAPFSNPHMRGGFINVSMETSRVDLVRAATEGVAHNLAWLIPHVEAFTGGAIREVAFVGGAARSHEWCQILADILDRRVASVIDPDTAVARSAARLALARLGALDRVEVEAGAELDSWHEPRADRRPLYECHQYQFEAAFEALRPISEALTAFHGGHE